MRKLIWNVSEIRSDGGDSDGWGMYSGCNHIPSQGWLSDGPHKDDEIVDGRKTPVATNNGVRFGNLWSVL